MQEQFRSEALNLEIFEIGRVSRCCSCCTNVETVFNSTNEANEFRRGALKSLIFFMTTTCIISMT